MEPVAFVFVSVLGFSKQLYIGSGYSSRTMACPKDPSVNPPGPGLFPQSSLLVVCP